MEEGLDYPHGHERQSQVTDPVWDGLQAPLTLTCTHIRKSVEGRGEQKLQPLLQRSSNSQQEDKKEWQHLPKLKLGPDLIDFM